MKDPKLYISEFWCKTSAYLAHFAGHQTNSKTVWRRHFFDASKAIYVALSPLILRGILNYSQLYSSLLHNWSNYLGSFPPRPDKQSKGVSYKTIATAFQSVWNLLGSNSKFQALRLVCTIAIGHWCISSGETKGPAFQTSHQCPLHGHVLEDPARHRPQAKYIMILLRTLKTPKAPAKCMQCSSKCCSTKSCAILVWVHWIQRSLYTVSS